MKTLDRIEGEKGMSLTFLKSVPGAVAFRTKTLPKVTIYIFSVAGNVQVSTNQVILENISSQKCPATIG